MRITKIISILLILLLYSSFSFARVFFVDQNSPFASDNNPGTKALPFKTISRAIKRLRPGDKVFIKAGVYREAITIKASGTPKKPIVISAYPGDKGKVIIKGSERFKNWKKIPGSPVWVASWKYHLKAHYPENWEDFGPYAKRCEMVFVNEKPLKQVLAKGLLRLNTFYVDEKEGKIYMSVPFGTSLKNVEVAVRQRGIFIHGSHLRIKGLTVMYVANHHKEAAFEVTGRDIVIEDCKAEWNNLDGFRISGRKILMKNCIANHDGRCGISASIHDSIIANCVTNENSWRFGPTWHAGGMKIGGGIPEGNLIIGHIAKNNRGKGIWFDWCKNNRVERCLLCGNLIAGLEFEASLGKNMVINNVICNNRVWKDALRWEKTGVGILIYETEDVHILNNTIVGNERYGILIAGGKRRIRKRIRGGKLIYVGDAISQRIKIFNNIIAENGVAGLGFWVWGESMKLRVLLSHRSDYNLWWPKEKRVEMPDQPFYVKGLLFRWIRFQDTHSVFLPPKFVDSKKGDYHLLPSSPAIDRALPFKEVKIDFEGHKRPIGKAPDIGAFEAY